jgi:hypothetical protein
LRRRRAQEYAEKATSRDASAQNVKKGNRSCHLDSLPLLQIDRGSSHTPGREANR